MNHDAELDRQAMDLSRQVRQAPPDEREKLKAKLAETVNKHFDVRQAAVSWQLTRLTEELDAPANRDQEAERFTTRS